MIHTRRVRRERTNLEAKTRPPNPIKLCFNEKGRSCRQANECCMFKEVVDGSVAELAEAQLFSKTIESNELTHMIPELIEDNDLFLSCDIVEDLVIIDRSRYSIDEGGLCVG